MTETYDLEELDDATRAYLLRVRDAKGKGMPGIYIGDSSWLPLVALLCGLTVIGLMMLLTLPPDGDPLKVAFLQSAGLLLGGWWCLYAVRRWIAAHSSRDLGHFLYADVLHLWEARGPRVTSTRIAYLRGAEREVVTDENGNQTGTNITVLTRDGEYSVATSKQKRAALLQDYLNALAALYAAADPDQGLPPPWELGMRARDAIDYWLDPATEPEVPPEERQVPWPQRVGRPRSGVPAYLLIVVCAVLSVVALYPLNRVWGDHVLFERARGGQPALLRAYLLDPRNTLHRDEAEKLLAEHYERLLTQLRARPGDADLHPVLLEHIKLLQTSARPTLSLRVKEVVKVEVFGNHPDAQMLNNTQAQQRERVFEQRVAGFLAAALGEQLVEIVRMPDEVPALIDITYSYVPEQDRPFNCSAKITFALRKRLEDQPVTKTLTSPHVQPVHNLGGGMHNDNDPRWIVELLTGQTPAASAPMGAPMP